MFARDPDSVGFRHSPEQTIEILKKQTPSPPTPLSLLPTPPGLNNITRPKSPPTPSATTFLNLGKFSSPAPPPPVPTPDPNSASLDLSSSSLPFKMPPSPPNNENVSIL